MRSKNKKNLISFISSQKRAQVMGPAQIPESTCPRRPQSHPTPSNLNPLLSTINGIALTPKKKGNIEGLKQREASPLSYLSLLSLSLCLPSILAMDIEDDVFFADLTKQIALLITEDDEDDNASQELTIQNSPVPPVQGYAHFPQMIMAPTYAYEVSSTRESRGTGVFIPRSSLTRRKSKPGMAHSTVINYQTKQFNRKVSAISDIPSTIEFNHNTNHRHYNKSGGVNKLNG